MSSSFSTSLAADLSDKDLISIGRATIYWGHADLVLGCIYNAINFTTEQDRGLFWDSKNSYDVIEEIEDQIADDRFPKSAIAHLEVLFQCYRDYKPLKNAIAHGVYCTSPKGVGFNNPGQAHLETSSIGLVLEQAAYTLDLAYSIQQHLMSRGDAPLEPLGARPVAR